MMKSKKKNGRGKAILTILIVFALACGVVFAINQTNEKQTLTKANEKKASKVATPTEEVDYYEINSDGKEDCYDGMETLGVDFYNDGDNIVIYCAAGESDTTNLFKSWNSNGNFTVKIVGAKTSSGHDYYVCNKEYGKLDSDGEVIVEPRTEVIKSTGKKVSIYPAADFKYNKSTCSHNKVYSVFDLTKIDAPSDVIIDEVNYVTENPAGNGRVSYGGDVTIEDDPDLVTIVTSESDDPTKYHPDTKVYNVKDSDGYKLTYDGKFTSYTAFYPEWYNFLKEQYINKGGKIVNNSNYDKNISKNSGGQKEPVNFENYYAFKGMDKSTALNPDTRSTNKNSKGSTKSKKISLTCDYKLDTDDIINIEKYNRQPLIDENGKMTDYYYDNSNTTYYKAHWEKTITKNFNYVWHSISKSSNTNASRTEKQTYECTLTCDEIVKVQFGPPVWTNP